ncbi:hypothetical protein [Methylobacterium iners]|uniref:hypothetical protein n=1 Tax=Methylobacterium iners TaxID=418707 RepID=UPI001EE20CE4|nr:hypothetical protein [Methylobacterium iners]
MASLLSKVSGVAERPLFGATPISAHHPELKFVMSASGVVVSLELLQQEHPAFSLLGSRRGGLFVGDYNARTYGQLGGVVSVEAFCALDFCSCRGSSRD